jgi:hypothetical protein
MHGTVPGLGGKRLERRVHRPCCRIAERFDAAPCLVHVLLRDLADDGDQCVTHD